MIKKSLLGVGLLVLLVAMTGIASAAGTFPLGCTDEHGEDNIPADMRNVVVDVTGDTIIITYINKSSVPVENLGIKEISLNIAGSLVPSSIDWPEKVYEPSFDPIVDKPWAGGNWGPFNLNMSFHGADNRTAGPVTLVFDEPVALECNDKGKVAAVHIISLNMDVGGEKPSVKVTNCGVCPEPIPEFPTVALPIAAILGLSFIFMRRKE